MLRRQLLLGALCLGVPLATWGDEINNPIPPTYKQVWGDEFTAFSRRTSGPTFDGLERGTGVWSEPGSWYTGDPRGFAGYGGYDWFVDPTWYGWPRDFHGQVTLTPDGLRLRSQPPIPSVSQHLPKVQGDGWSASPGVRHPGAAPWLSAQVLSFNSVRIKPPFYIEIRAKMPAGVGRPFSALWLATGAHFIPHRDQNGQEYEIDIHEGFGDSDKLHTTIHWNPSRLTRDYPSNPVVDRPSGVDLSTSFNTWGCLVTLSEQIFYFNGIKVGQAATPPKANIDQPFGIIFDVSAGLPWHGGGAPSGGPHDMIVRYVRLYAPDSHGLTLTTRLHE